MNILFIKHFFVGFMISEIPRVSVSVFGDCPYSVIFPYIYIYIYLVNMSYYYYLYFIFSADVGTS